MLNKKAAAYGIAITALLISAPSAALAATDPYVAPPGVQVQGASIDTCHVSHVEFDAGYFTPGSHVSATIAGPDAAHASVTGDTAAGDGSLMVTFHPAPDEHGTYTLTFTGTAPEPLADGASPGPVVAMVNAPVVALTSMAANVFGVVTEANAVPRTYTAVISVSDGGGCGAPAPAAAVVHDDVTTLAITGGSVSPWMIGGGAAALAVGGVLVGISVIRRARRG